MRIVWRGIKNINILKPNALACGILIVKSCETITGMKKMIIYKRYGRSRQPAVYITWPVLVVGITPTIFWPREYGRGSKTLQIIWKGPPYVFSSIYSTRTCKPWKTWQNKFFFAFVMWTGPSTKHLVEVAATQIQDWSLVLNILLYLLSMVKSSAAEKIPIKKLTYIIDEVWSNLCIPFSSVKKGHSLSSLFTNTGSHVQHLTLTILVPCEMFCHVHSCT